MLALNPELIRSFLPANITLHESNLAVLPGSGAVIFHLKSLSSLSRREAGQLAPAPQLGDLEAWAGAHDREPSIYPPPGGWLGIPEGCPARGVEQVPIAMLLASAAQQAWLVQPDRSHEYQYTTGF